MALNADALRESVLFDHDQARQIDRQVADKRHRGFVPPGASSGDIVRGTPSPQIRALAQRFYDTLDAIEQHLFHAKVALCATQVDGASDEMTYYVTKARSIDTCLDLACEWDVVSDSSRIVDLLSKLPAGRSVSERTADGRLIKYTLRSGATFIDKPLPRIRRAQYRLPGGSRDIADQDDLDAAPVRPGRDDYTPMGDFALTDIAEAADYRQTVAKHFPRDRDAIIEGPPGSGKTNIGLMRLRTLFDSDAASPERAGGKPGYYREGRTRVMVHHEQLTEYLSRSAKALQIGQVRVETFNSRFGADARSAGLLAGKRRNESVCLTSLKGQLPAASAVFAGFRAAVAARWTNRQNDLRQRAAALPADATELLWRVLTGWVAAVGRATVDATGRLPADCNLAIVVAAWLDDHRRRHPWPPRGSPPVSEVVKAIIGALVPKVGAMPETCDTAEFAGLAGCAATIGMEPADFSDAIGEWREHEAAGTGHSEADAVLAAWLASQILLLPPPLPVNGNGPGDVRHGEDLPPGPAPVVGVRADRITHVLIDEAQDLSPMHLLALRRSIDPDATFTVTGDLRQRITLGRGLRSWDDLGLRAVKAKVFDRNYRQSYHLGRFVAELHRLLYGEPAAWTAGRARLGRKPELRIVGEAAGIGRAAGAAVADALERVPGGRVGVLYDRDVPQATLDAWQAHLDAAEKTSSIAAKRPDVRLRHVDDTKGQEFDAVVLIGDAARWTGGLSEACATDAGDVLRNRLYVAASRARQSLVIVCRGRPAAFGPLIEAGVCELVHVAES